MVDRISILGSTGSIGTQAIQVCKKLGIQVDALAVKGNIDLLEKQISELHPKVVAVFDEEKAELLKHRLSASNICVLSGMEGLCAVACETDSRLVLNSVVGMVGLKPTLEAISAKKDIALANKESLVAGGEIVIKALEKNKRKIFPVDSEHSAIFQCLQGMNNKRELKKLILTASGGPFFGKTAEELQNVTKAQTLKHPNWDMGAKITTDCATMMNKGLEIAEASWLFDVPVDNIDVVIHRESIIHSMIEYMDNSVIAQMGLPDMRIPIQYAITYPERYESMVGELDLSEIAKLSFFKPDYETFLCLKACKQALKQGGLAMAVVNGANEQAVKLFLEDKIIFLDIGRIVYKTFNELKISKEVTFDNIIEADKQARQFVLCNLKTEN